MVGGLWRLVAVFLAGPWTVLCLALTHLPSFAGLRPLPLWRDANLTRVFFIGDTHGDAHCAKEWVRRTGLINFEAKPWIWTGSKISDAIVFLGDYVDKGPTSRQVLEFVREVEVWL